MTNHTVASNIFSPVKHRYSLALAEIDAKSPNILDVGGYKSRKNIVDTFFSNPMYTSLNIGNAWYKDVAVDLLYDGVTIPFADSAFDYVISVDILEHVTLENRLHILSEIVRVATKKAVVVTPIRLPGRETDESYVLDICKRYGVDPPPSLVEHELYGLPFLNEIETYVSLLGGTYKYATNKKDYWSIQTAMLWNTILLNGDSELVNRKVQEFQEKQLISQPYPQKAEDAYRCVLVFDK